MKTPMIVAVVALVGVIGLLIWDARQRPDTVNGGPPPSRERVGRAREPASVLESASSDEELLKLKNAPTIDALSINSSKVTSRSLEALGRFPKLRQLTIRETPLDSLAVIAISRLSLNTLVLSHTGVTDVMIKPLANIKHLTFLLIEEPTLGDPAMATIGQLSELETLQFEGTPITDAALASLKTLRNLRSLKLSSKKITSVGMTELECLSELRSLELAGTSVGKAGLPHLAKLGHLSYLDVRDCRVGGDAVPELKRFTQLRQLMVPPDFSNSAFVQLRRALPATRISNGMGI